MKFNWQSSSHWKRKKKCNEKNLMSVQIKRHESWKAAKIINWWAAQQQQLQQFKAQFSSQSKNHAKALPLIEISLNLINPHLLALLSWFSNLSWTTNISLLPETIYHFHVYRKTMKIEAFGVELIILKHLFYLRKKSVSKFLYEATRRHRRCYTSTKRQQESY